MEYIGTDASGQAGKPHGTREAARGGEGPRPQRTPRPAATAALTGDPDPPLLTGGLTLEKPHSGALRGVAIDYLTMSVPVRTAARLLDLTASDVAGSERPGFMASERRAGRLGPVWRRYEPRQESKLWGLDYESWEWDGSSSHPAAELLRAWECRPSRVDVAFDLDSTMTADQFIEQTREHFERAGFTDGITGQGGINTRYIGSKASEKRIRIYRKDLQSESWAAVHGVTLRVELILKDATAQAWWAVWDRSKQAGYQGAAAIIRTMCGVELIEEAGDPPEVVAVGGLDLAGELATFAKQYAARLTAYQRAGVDVWPLIADQMARASQRTQERSRGYASKLKAAGSDQVQEIARQIILAGTGNTS